MGADARRATTGRGQPTPGEALRRGAEQIWASVETTRELLRVMFREPEAIEDIDRRAVVRGDDHCLPTSGPSTGAAKKAGVAQSADPEATGTVLVAALAYFPIVQLLIGHTPGNLDADGSAKRGSGWPKACSPAHRRPDVPLQGRLPNSRETVGQPNAWRTGIRHGEVIYVPTAEITPGRSHPRREVRRAGSTGSGARLPVRSRRRAHRHRERAHQGLEGDVRRLPRAAGRAERRAVRPVRPGRGLPEIRRRQEARRRRAVVSGQPRHRAARRRPRRRRRQGHRLRPGQPQERRLPGDACTRTASRCSRVRAATWRR